METDINMNNNFIQNVATPMSSHQGANKGYCDYNRQKEGRIMVSLSMNQNDLFEIPAPKFGSSAVNKNYVDAKIPSVDSTQFIKKTGDQMGGDLDMNSNFVKNVGINLSDDTTVVPRSYVDSFVNSAIRNPLTRDLYMSNFQIKQLKTPIDEKDAINKKYFDEQLLNSHLLPSHIENAFKYLLDQDESSSERNIVHGVVDFNGSPHKNKKGYSIDLVYTQGTQNYNSKIGINLFPLPIGKYTIIMEYYFPEDTNICFVAGATTAVINKQTTTNFIDYKKHLVQFDQQTKDTPDYLFFNIRGSATTSTNPEGYLVFYGVKEWVDSVPPQIYDKALESSIFECEGGKMKMNMDLDLNGNSLKGVSVNSPFFIQGWYDQSKDSHGIYLNPVSVLQIIPFDCVLNKIVCYFEKRKAQGTNLAIDITLVGSSSFYNLIRFSLISDKAEINTNVSINKNDLMKIRFPINENPNLVLITKGVFAFILPHDDFTRKSSFAKDIK